MSDMDVRISRVKDQISIVELFLHLGLGDRVERSGEHQINCPFEDEHVSADRNKSARVYPHTNTMYCWTCTWGGDIVAFIQRYNKLGNMGDAIEWLEINVLKEAPEKKKSHFYAMAERARQRKDVTTKDLELHREMLEMRVNGVLKAIRLKTRPWQYGAIVVGVEHYEGLLYDLHCGVHGDEMAERCDYGKWIGRYDEWYTDITQFIKDTWRFVRGAGETFAKESV